MKCLALLILVLVTACGSVRAPAADASTGNPDAAPDADPCATQTCECTPATEDADCGAHAYCDTTAGRQCRCVAGFTDGANGCTWTGTVLDPGFAATDKWTSTGGAVLDPTAQGTVDPGEATFAAAAQCGLATVSQTLVMPTSAKGGPLVLELSYANEVDMGSFTSVAMGVSFAGGWTLLPPFTDASIHTVRVCLGGGGYAPDGTAGAGAPVDLAIGPFTQPATCPSPTTPFVIDHAEIVPANPGECGTMPGFGPNFDAEGDGGYVFTTSGTSSGAFVPGIGEGGSKAARLTRGQRCDSATMTAPITVPSVANPALTMYVGVSNNGATGTMTVANPGAFGTPLANMALPPPGFVGTWHSCLPPALRGQATSIIFRLDSGSGACTDNLGYQVWVDDLKVVDDPSCASTDQLTDPGFEAEDTPFGAFSTTTPLINAGTATIETGSSAHGGTHYLALASRARCSSAGIRLLPTVPASTATAGPALKFFANVANNPIASVTVKAGTQSTTLANGGGYVPYTVCLDPLYAGRPQQVTIGMYGGTGTCSATGTTETAWIDDVSVTTDPSCPTM